METILSYIPVGGLIVFGIGSLIAVKVELAKRPTFRQAEDKFKDVDVCQSDHKALNDKIECIPKMNETVTAIKTTLDLIVEGKIKFKGDDK